MIACCHQVKNCRFYKNQTGLVSSHRHAKVANCIIDSNTVIGFDLTGNRDTITDCIIRYNAIGVNDANGDPGWTNITTKNLIENNTTGIQLSCYWDEITCNKICNNTSYDLKYIYTGNANVSNNYWCTTDSASTAAVVYDGHENASYGLVSFMPLDNTCYLTIPNGITATENSSFKLFPNPTTDHLFLEFPENVSTAKIELFDLLGDLIYMNETTGQRSEIDLSSYSNGIYFIHVLTKDKNFAVQKFIKQ